MGQHLLELFDVIFFFERALHSLLELSLLDYGLSYQLDDLFCFRAVVVVVDVLFMERIVLVSQKGELFRDHVHQDNQNSLYHKRILDSFIVHDVLEACGERLEAVFVFERNDPAQPENLNYILVTTKKEG